MYRVKLVIGLFHIAVLCSFQMYTLNARDFIENDPNHKAFKTITGKLSIHSAEAIEFYGTF